MKNTGLALAPVLLLGAGMLVLLLGADLQLVQNSSRYESRGCHAVGHAGAFA